MLGKMIRYLVGLMLLKFSRFVTIKLPSSSFCFLANFINHPPGLIQAKLFQEVPLGVKAKQVHSNVLLLISFDM